MFVKGAISRCAKFGGLGPSWLSDATRSESGSLSDHIAPDTLYAARFQGSRAFLPATTLKY